MDYKTQKERLEQELRFLKESFDAEVINKEEFEKGRNRIEKKLKEIQAQASKQISEEPQTEQLERQAKIEETAKAEEPKKEAEIAREAEKIQEKGEEYAKPVETKEPLPEKQKEAIEEGKKGNKLFRYAIVFIVLVLAVFFIYSFLKGSIQNTQEKAALRLVAACGSNEDCKQQGKEGFCLNPGTRDAKCEFKEIQKTNVIILNDRKNCFNCDTTRVLSILEEWLGELNAEEIAYGTEKGKSLAEKFDAKALPMYILDENITKKPKFQQLKQIFTKKNNSYILSEDASGSTFYFKRENVSNKLELFIVAGDNAGIKAEKNLQEFLMTFKDVKFEKHLSTDKLAQELGVKTFPTFLINNRVKFSGMHPADTIKENFCSLNKAEACAKTLSRSLV